MSNTSLTYKAEWCDRCGTQIGDKTPTGYIPSRDLDFVSHHHTARILCQPCDDHIFEECERYYHQPPEWIRPQATALMHVAYPIRVAT